MLKVFIPSSAEFDLYRDELKEMYEASQEKICDTNDFYFVVKNTLFYGFVKNDILIGAVYFFIESGRLYMNAYAGRGHLEANIECVKLSTTWFSCDIYAEAQNRASALCLLRSGFKRRTGKLFVYKQEQPLRKD